MGQSFVIEINCPERSGCFLKIGQALQQAPAGAELRIGPGIYYEKPLVIEKDITLQGADAGRTEIRLIDPNEVALALEGDDRPLTVTIRDLTLQGGPAFSIGERDIWTGAALLVLGPSSASTSPPPSQLTIERSRIFGWRGIAVSGNARVSLLRSTLLAQSAGIVAMGGEVYVLESRLEGSFFGKQDAVGLDLLFALKAQVENSTIKGWKGVGISYAVPVPAPQQERGRPGEEGPLLIAIGNDIEENGTGVVLAGLVDAKFERNRILDNEGYGLQLVVFPCVPVRPEEASAFRGTLQGKENEISGNGKGDLCPEDYPWPAGFKRP